MAQDCFSMMTQTPGMAASQGPKWKAADHGEFEIDDAFGDVDHRHVEDIEELPYGALPGIQKGVLLVANADAFTDRRMTWTHPAEVAATKPDRPILHLPKKGKKH